MATEPPTRTVLLRHEPITAPSARIRVVIDDLIDLILGLQLASRTPMPRLRPGLAPLPVPTLQLLCLLPRFRAALLA
jgi:hypothetical protein